jgi:hypothetical protein
MPSSFARLVLSACTLSAIAVTAPTADATVAAGPNDRAFDAVSAFEAKIVSSSSGYQAFAVTGILRGQSAEQTIPFTFGDADTAARYAPSCERYALIALKDAGHFSFVVVTNGYVNPNDGTMPVVSCRLERL